jgi:hypothetical protein
LICLTTQREEECIAEELFCLVIAVDFMFLFYNA